jgi:methionyl-tRNA synthetase
MNRKFITTTLPYANSPAHIGHAFEFIIADALVRYFKYRGDNVFFNIGLDEHGLKIQQASARAGVTPQVYVDKLSESWKAFIEIFEINSYDNFYRTSDGNHTLKVQKFWREAVERGDIYKKKYTGTYCVGCEEFKNERDLIDSPDGAHDAVFTDPGNAHVDPQLVLRKVCPDHPTTKLQEVEEENYFFRLSKYREQFLQWLHVSDKFFEPKKKIKEFDKIIEDLQDISVSRMKDTVSWGASVPDDDTQTIYVWFDALLNYIFAAGYYDDEESFQEKWNDSEVIQICGPDNLKFQSVIFQGLLISAGIKKSDKLLVHGTILDREGRKMSKSVGNVVDPVAQVQKYGIDAVRYYALKGLRTYGNSSWDEELLINTYNSDLADDYGNLVTRVTVLAGKALKEFEDDPNVELDYSYVEGDKWCVGFDQRIHNVKTLWNNYLVSDALSETNKLVKELNKRIGDAEPWKDLRNGWVLILELHYAINKINELYYPVIPGKAGEIKVALKNCEKIKPFPKLEIKEKQEL